MPLAGHISPKLGNLAALKYLNLESNQLGGESIPQERMLPKPQGHVLPMRR